MLAISQEKKKLLEQLCKKHNVQKAYLFGSATSDNFDIQSSDLDIVVEFSDSIDLIQYSRNYFSFQFGLEQLFNKRIDLLTFKELKNPIMIQEIERSKVELYAA